MTLECKFPFLIQVHPSVFQLWQSRQLGFNSGSSEGFWRANWFHIRWTPAASESFRSSRQGVFAKHKFGFRVDGPQGFQLWQSSPLRFREASSSLSPGTRRLAIQAAIANAPPSPEIVASSKLTISRRPFGLALTFREQLRR